MAPAERMAIASRFAAAFKTGDAAALTALLASDVHMVSDGGGKVSAARRPLAGREEVLHFLLGLHRLAKATGIDASASLALDEVNGEPAICLRINNELDGVFVASVEDGRIAALRVVRNPDKLAFLARQLSARGVKAGVH